MADRPAPTIRTSSPPPACSATAWANGEEFTQRQVDRTKPLRLYRRSTGTFRGRASRLHVHANTFMLRSQLGRLRRAARPANAAGQMRLDGAPVSRPDAAIVLRNLQHLAAQLMTMMRGKV